MDHQTQGFHPAPERFRDYLLFLARSSLGRQERALLTPSDLVQETLLEAHRKRAQFRGTTDWELAGWLRQMLAWCIADAVRGLHRGKRDVSRQLSLQGALEESSSRLEAWLAADQSSPSQRAQREEELLRLASVLAHLPDDQRQAVERKYLHGESVATIASAMGRTEMAVGGLLRRGLARMREQLTHDR